MTLQQSPPPLLARVAGVTALACALAVALAGCDVGPRESPLSPDPSHSASESPSPRVLEPPSPSPSESVSPVSGLSADDVANIRDAVSSGNTAAIDGYLTDPTRVVIAASDADSRFSPVDAVLSLDYVHPGVGVWDFDLPPETIAGYRASAFYGAYFPEDVIVGRSDAHAVVAFSPHDGKIDTILMSIDESLLLG